MAQALPLGALCADWPAQSTYAGAAPPIRPTSAREGDEGATVGVTSAAAQKGQEKANGPQLSKVAAGRVRGTRTVNKGIGHPQG